jgi:hypothetical protein
MNKIVATIDAQGFTCNKIFYPREISFISNKIDIRVEFDTNLSYEHMNPQDHKTNSYLENYVLGMSLKPLTKTNINCYNFIVEIYEQIISDDKNLLGLKNQQLESILNLLNIPFIDLSKEGCPPINLLNNQFGPIKFCSFHNKNIKNYKSGRCAHFKAQILWKWLTSDIIYYEP